MLLRCLLMKALWTGCEGIPLALLVVTGRMNFLSFYSSGNVFISPLSLKQSFRRYGLLVGLFWVNTLALSLYLPQLLWRSPLVLMQFPSYVMVLSLNSDTCTHVWACCGSPRTISDIVPRVSSSLFLKQGLSLTRKSPSRLGRLASGPQIHLSQPPLLWDCRPPCVPFVYRFWGLT